MLIVPHALQCVVFFFFFFFFVFYRIWHFASCVLNSNLIFCQTSLTRELNIKVVGFVLKKLLTYSKMLIVPHALHFVDSCIFVINSFNTVWHTVLVSVPPPPFPPFFLSDLACLSKFTYQRAHSKSCSVIPPPFPQFFFIRFSFGPFYTASTSLWQRSYGEGILLSYGRILPRLRCSCYILLCPCLSSPE